jgi:hypothetical protein
MKKILLIFNISLLTISTYAQVINDHCNSAVNLGTLPAPGACAGGIQDGAAVNAVSGTTTINATTDNPLIANSNCGFSGQSNDVWFTFIASGTTININITPGIAPYLINPRIDLYKGSCTSFLGQGCAVGNASGNLTTSISQTTIGETYFLQVRGNTSSTEGNFQLSVDNDIDCNNCLRTSIITANPLPVNGEYQPGTVVNFCYHITEWVNQNTNWLHGVQVTWGSGWTNTLGSPTSYTPAASCSTAGGWRWYPSCTSSASGQIFGPGFYYKYNPISTGSPGNNFGDDCNTPNWNFCFSLTVAAGYNPGSDLSVTINTTGDGESGSWSSAGCAGDPPNVFLAQGAYTAPVLSASISQTTGTNPTCDGSLTTFTANITNGGTAPTYQWNLDGIPVGTNSPTFSTNTLLNGQIITCDVTSNLTGVTGSPTTSNAITMTVNPVPSTPTINASGPTTFCQGGSVTLTASPSSGYFWSNGSTTQNVIVTSSQNDSVTVTDVNGCSATSSVTTITVLPLPTALITANGPTTFCLGDSVTLTAGSSNSYLWSNGSTTQSITVESSENNSVTVTDINGCSATSAVTIVTVNPQPDLLITNPDATCASNTIDISASAITTGSTSGTLTYWQDSTTTVPLSSGFYTSVDTSGTFYISLTSGGCSDTEPVIVSISNDCVWPGDANHDALVNNFDLLPIGIFYSQPGQPRASTSNSWQAYLSINWGTAQINGEDIKHTDCDGDGIINNNDTLAINQNFSSTHAIATNNYGEARTTDPDIYFVTNNSSYNAGDWIDAEIWTGNSTTYVTNLYGIAFDINYDASLVESGTESLTYPASWLGTPATNAITITKIDPLAAIAHGGITRNDHINVNGYGKIADFRFKANTAITSTSVLHLSVINYAANDSVGAPVLFNTINDSITINAIGTGITGESSFSGFNIYPNPFTSQTTISFTENQKNTTIRIMDVVGKEIKTINFSGKQLIIEKGEMSKGIYFVEVTDENKKVVNKKIVLQ